MLAPKEDAEEEEEDDFYDEIQQFSPEVHVRSHDLLCVIEDFNTHVGMTVNTDKIGLWERIGVVTSTAMDSGSVISVRGI